MLKCTSVTQKLMSYIHIERYIIHNYVSCFKRLSWCISTSNWTFKPYVSQEPQNMVTVAEYRLPEAKPGTAMYFDFPRKIQTRRITFKLLGDITAFADDPTEQDDPGSRGLPVAVGLSLSNRIKLYYYDDPYELGKWASLSAVWNELWFTCTRRKEEKGFVSWVIDFDRFVVLYFYS